MIITLRETVFTAQGTVPNVYLEKGRERYV